MALEMRTECERCHVPLTHMVKAFICSYQCTFRPDCTASMDAICPNCVGELVRRPTRFTYTEDPLGKASVIKDFLPPPAELVFRRDIQGHDVLEPIER